MHAGHKINSSGIGIRTEDGGTRASAIVQRYAHAAKMRASFTGIESRRLTGAGLYRDAVVNE